jgi:hypothetical protein
MVNGLDNENLGVLGSLRETRMNGQPDRGYQNDDDLSADSPQQDAEGGAESVGFVRRKEAGASKTGAFRGWSLGTRVRFVPCFLFVLFEPFVVG